MGMEIERKFLVHKTLWSTLKKPQGNYLKQGYIYSDLNKTIRIRTTNTQGFLTIKGKSSINGLSRSEFEYEIPKDEALVLLKQFTNTGIEKMRYKILFEGLYWEVDEFYGSNEGLIMAELELTSEAQSFSKPDWIQEEVTGDQRYYNSYLAEHPFKHWN